MTASHLLPVDERDLLDLITDLAIPGISAPEFALVEPDLDSRSPEGIADPASSADVLRGVAQKYRVRCLSHGQPPLKSPKVLSPPPCAGA